LYPWFCDQKTKVGVRYEERHFVYRGFVCFVEVSFGMKTRVCIEVTKGVGTTELAPRSSQFDRDYLWFGGQLQKETWVVPKTL